MKLVKKWFNDKKMTNLYPNIPIKIENESATKLTIQGIYDDTPQVLTLQGGSATFTPSYAGQYAGYFTNSAVDVVGTIQFEITPLIDPVLKSLITQRHKLMADISDIENGKVKAIQNPNGISMQIMDITAMRAELDKVLAKINDYYRQKNGQPPFVLAGFGNIGS